MAKFNTSIKQIQELVDLSKQSINTENLNKSIASVVSALAIMGQLATKASGSDLSKMKKQYSELLKMTKEIEDFKSKSAKKDSDNDTPAIKKKNSLYIDEMKIKEKNIKLNNKLLAFETKMQGFAGGKIKSVQKELANIRLLEKEYKDIGNQLLTQKLTTQQINKLSLRRVDIEGKIANQQRLTSNIANKGTLASNTRSNLSIGKLASRASFVSTAMLSYKSIDLIQSIFRDIVGTAIDVEDQLSKTFSIAINKSEEFRSSMRTGVLNTMRDFNLTLEDTADALYKIVSAQINEKSALYVLTQSGMLAKANFADIDDTTKLLASVINAFNMEASEAGTISDMVTQTVKLGITTGKELADNYSKLIPLASATGVEFSELSAVMATLTNNGIETDKSATSLAQVFQMITNPTAKSKEILDKYGITLSATELKQKGLIKTFDKLIPLMLDESFEIAKSRRGRIALQSILENTNELYENHEKIMNSNGETYKVYAERMNTLTAQWDKFTRGLTNSIVKFKATENAVSGLMSIFRSMNAIFDKNLGLGELPTIVDLVAGNQGVLNYSEARKDLESYFNQYKDGEIDIISLSDKIRKFNKEFSYLGANINTSTTDFASLNDELLKLSNMQRAVATLESAQTQLKLANDRMLEIDAIKERTPEWADYQKSLDVIKGYEKEYNDRVMSMLSERSKDGTKKYSNQYDIDKQKDKIRKDIDDRIKKEMSINSINPLKLAIPAFGGALTAYDIFKRLLEGNNKETSPIISQILNAQEEAEKMIVDSTKKIDESTNEVNKALLLSLEAREDIIDKFTKGFEKLSSATSLDISKESLQKMKVSSIDKDDPFLFVAKNLLLKDKKASQDFIKEIESWGLDKDVEDALVSRVEYQIDKINMSISDIDAKIFDFKSSLSFKDQEGLFAAGILDTSNLKTLNILANNYRKALMNNDISEEDRIQILRSMIGLAENDVQKKEVEKIINDLIDMADDATVSARLRKKTSLGGAFMNKIGFNTDTYAMGKKISAGDASEEEILAQTEAFNQMVAETTINSTREMYDILEQMQIQSIENQLKRKLDALDAEEEAQINAVNSEILTEEHRNREINAINNKYNKKREKEEEKAAKKQAKINKRMAMVDATMNFATASMGIWSFSKGNPAIQIPLQLLLLAAYGANMKLISDTKFRDGGMLEGASHENGGIPLFGRSGNYYGEAEGGEIIFSKRASDKNTELLLSMNKHLSSGGDISTFLSSYLNGRSSGGNKNVGSMYRDGGMTRRFSTNEATIDSGMFERFAFIDLQGVDERQIYRMSRIGKLKDRGI